MTDKEEDKLIEARKEEAKSISDFMDKTYNECLRLGLSISINIKNGRIQWSKR